MVFLNFEWFLFVHYRFVNIYPHFFGKLKTRYVIDFKQVVRLVEKTCGKLFLNVDK